MWNIFKRLTPSLMLIFTITGCSSVQLASNESNANAQKFDAEGNQAVIYVIQNGGYAAGMALFQILVDGQPQGSISGWTYHRVIVPSGKHTIIATSPENEELIQIDTKPGSVNFVGVPSIIGWKIMRVGNIQQLTELNGKDAVKQAKLARGIR
jgi:hypothetical protein